ncbi:MAG: diguanylate cyclase [Thermoanaerobaculia bacterium]|nr:diguanylate cyclase [Thermoanaerobaculia bacterium]
MDTTTQLEPVVEVSVASRRTRVGLAVLSVVVVLGLMVLQLVEAEVSRGRMIGIDSASEAPAGLRVIGVEHASPAERAGLQVGDLITAVAGDPIESGSDYDVSAASFEPDAPVVFAVVRGDIGRTVEVRPGLAYPWRALLPDLLVALFYLAIALLSLLQEPWDLRARLLGWFSLAVALELSMPGYTVGNPRLAMASQVVFILLTGLQVGLELHLAAVIPKPQAWLRRNRWAVVGFYGLGALIGLTILIPFLFESVGTSWIWSSERAERLLLDFGMPIWALGVVALLARPALSYPETRGRHQAALVLGGVMPWAAFVLASSFLDLTGLPDPGWMAVVEPLALLCYPLAIFAAIFRYRLFDIELAVRRTLVYSTLTTVSVVVFYLLIGLGGALFSRFLDREGSVWPVAGATLILGLLFTPMRHWLERQVYRRFFPERLALRSALTELAAELPIQGTLPAMGKHLVQRLGEVFGVRWATLMVTDPSSGHLATLSSSLQSFGEELEFSLLLPSNDPGLMLLSRSGKPFRARQLYTKSPPLARRLQQLKASHLVPLTREGRLIGLLVLGPKESGDDYQGEELELLNLLAHHAVSVIDNARLFESATRDGLTGLLRREMILEILDRELQRAVRHDRPLAIGMVDLDHFKEVNDRFGHLSGDAVLRWVSHTLETGLRATDFIGRYGGEEFLIVLPETDLEGAVRVAQKVRSLVEERTLSNDEGQAIRATVSIGLQAVKPGESVTANELISGADESLYEAKAAGRNRVAPSLPSAS